MLDLYKRAAARRLYRFLPPSGYQVRLYGLLPQTLIAAVADTVTGRHCVRGRA